MLRSGMLLLSLSLLLPACARDFDPPPVEPPQVTITSVQPDAGFAGDVVVLCGANFADPPSGPQVTVAGAPAEIVESPDEGFNAACAGERLGIRLPVVGDPGPATITVTTQHSQASLDVSPDDPSRAALIYLGPGHPTGDDLDAGVDIRARPIAVSACTVQVGETPMDWLAMAASESRLIQLVEADTGLPFGFGACDTPVSIQIVPTAVARDDEGWSIDFRLVYSAVSLDGSELIVPTLYKAQGTFARRLDEPGAVTASSPQEIAPLPEFTDPRSGSIERLVPWQIWPLCRERQPDGTCTNPELIVSHPDAPALAVVSADPPAGGPDDDPIPGFTITPPAPPGGEDWRCGEPAQVVDLVHQRDQAVNALWVLLGAGDDQPGAGIWRADLDPPAAPVQVWPPSIAEPDDLAEFCGWRLAAVTARKATGNDPTQTRIYAADAEAAFVVELGPVGPGLDDLVPIRYGLLPAPAFALATGRFAYYDPDQLITHEFLYAATAAGLVVLDTAADPAGQEDGYMDVLEWVELGDALRGSAQSLTSIAAFDPGDPMADPPVPPTADRLALVDAAQDHWVRFEAGQPLSGLRVEPLLSTLVQAAPSRLVDGFWLADASVSTLRLVDRRTDVQLFQLRAQDRNTPAQAGQSSGRLMTTWVNGREILVLAVPADEQPDPDRPLFDRIRLIAMPGELPEGTSCERDPAEAATVDAVMPFHDMVWLVGRDPVVQLVRYGHKGEAGPADDVPGELQTIWLDLEGSLTEGQPMLEQERIDLPPELQLIRVSPRHQIRAMLLLENSTHTIDVADPLLDPDTSMASYQLPNQLANFASDMVAVRPGDPSRPVYLLAMPMTQLGEVMLVGLDPLAETPAQRQRVKHLVTGGLPVWVFASPDERRLYVTHPTENRVSILNLDCEPLPECVEVVRTVTVDDNPTEVHFDPGGAKAYLNHLYNNVISVFE